MKGAPEPLGLDLTLLEGRYDGPIHVHVPDTKYDLYVVPNDSLEDYRTNVKMNLAGIYFVLGYLESDEENLYIGQAAVRKDDRLGTIQHILENIRNGKHGFCDRAIMLVAPPEDFGSTELDLMEDAFITLAREAGRTHMSNRTGAHAGKVREHLRCRISKIVENTRLMLATMGVMVLEPPLESEHCSDVPLAGEDEDIYVESRGPVREVSSEFYSHRRKENRATLVRSGNEWVLKKGSWLLAAKTERVAEERVRHARLIDGNVTVGDIPFTSPNKAGVFVSGNAANSRTFWKDEEGRTLGEYIENGEI